MVKRKIKSIKESILSTITLVVLALVIVIYGGYRIYQNSVQDLDIFLVEDGTEIVSSGDDTSNIAPLGYVCKDSLARFAVHNSCGYQSFRSLTYRCRYNTQIVKLGYSKNRDRSVCKSYIDWYRQAERVCSVSCGGSTPLPVPSPSLPPSCVKSPPECLDPSTGAMTLCDPKPGTVWCTPKQIPPAGCRWKEVQCIQAPCRPIIVCPSSGNFPD